MTAAVCLLVYLFNLDFEYADYDKALGKEIKRAEKVLQDAEPGNKKGQYDPDTIKDFKKQIEKAKVVYRDKESEYEQQKKSLMEDIHFNIIFKGIYIRRWLRDRKFYEEEIRR